MFAHDAVYVDSKDLPKRTVLDKILKDMIYEILLHSKYGGFQRELWSMVYRIFVKKIRSGANFNRDVEYLLCVIDVFTKFTWVKPLTDKKDKMIS